MSVAAVAQQTPRPKATQANLLRCFLVRRLWLLVGDAISLDWYVEATEAPESTAPSSMAETGG